MQKNIICNYEIFKKYENSTLNKLEKEQFSILAVLEFSNEIRRIFKDFYNINFNFKEEMSARQYYYSKTYSLNYKGY